MIESVRLIPFMLLIATGQASDCRYYLETVETLSNGGIFKKELGINDYRIFEKYSEPKSKSFWFDAQLLKGGFIDFRVLTKTEEDHRAKRIYAAKEFDSMIIHFGNRARGIYGSWKYGDNLSAFNNEIANGVDMTNAAARTWTGIQAQRNGFTVIKIMSYHPEEPPFTSVSVQFTKPEISHPHYHQP